MAGRPIYESAANRKAEAAIAQRIANQFGLILEATERLSCFDYWACRDGKRIAALEIKCRTHTLTTYRTLILSQQKVDRLRAFALAHNVPALLVVDFSGALALLSLATPAPLKRGGRSDRGDAADMEMVYDFPVAQFRRIEDGWPAPLRAEKGLESNSDSGSVATNRLLSNGASCSLRPVSRFQGEDVLLGNKRPSQQNGSKPKNEVANKMEFGMAGPPSDRADQRGSNSRSQQIKFAKTGPYSGVSECDRYFVTSGCIGRDLWATLAYARGRPPVLLHRAESDGSNAGIAKARADCKASCVAHLAREA